MTDAIKYALELGHELRDIDFIFCNEGDRLKYKTKVVWADVSDEDKWPLLRELAERFKLDYGEVVKYVVKGDNKNYKDGGEGETQEKKHG